MNSSEPEKVSAGGKTVKMEPASDVADAEPSRQMDVKIEVAEELNENLTNPKKKKNRGKRLSKSVRIARKKQKAALALLALIQANEGNKIGEESVCASTTMGKVDASTQTGEGKVGAATTTTTKVNASTQTDKEVKKKRNRGRNKRLPRNLRERLKKHKAQYLNQVVSKTSKVEV
ncbi:unnamed protein product [Meloidogyne enterolobii]|uniref:Uncharacterized protein n=2 Tax=Meloidogyne enterolobii TaxID=390850 RepID=A0A6V7VSY7_MELEN|nr:unnamed protein product [Meloidogyne enterolobii]